MLVDIHTHVLPGLDDGAPDMETALAMAEMAYEDGITHMILTPHYIRGSMENSRACVEKSISMLRKELMAREIKMEVFSGNEIFISIDTAELLENRNVCTLNGSSYVLVELPLGEIPHYTDRALFNLSLYGYRPIIAHPERNSEVIDNPGILRQFLEKKNIAAG